jgi:xanthine/CO dehydrogenase XdhC/CoxF family maturation factor
MVAELEAAVHSGASSVIRHDAGGEIEVFVEVVQPRVPLVVFGAGADAAPLVTIARQLGWHVTVVDTKARASCLERFAHADTVVLCRPEEVGAQVPLTDAPVAVVMTHNYMHDLDVLRVLVSRSVRYVGCLGPSRRTEGLLSQLGGAAGAWQTPSLGVLHAPVGMDIGAEGPAEIARAVSAEIVAVLSGRRGGHLPRRGGSIHGDERRNGTPSTSAVRARDGLSQVALRAAGDSF